GNSGLYQSALDGKRTKPASELGGGTSAYGGRGEFSVSQTGIIAFSQAKPHVPADIAVLNGGSGAKLLTNVNEGLFAGKKLGAVEEFWYESSKDKRKIQGWIIKPPDFD